MKLKNLVIVASMLIAVSANAQTQVPNDFTAGTPARAAEVNANFSELETAANQNAADISANTADMAANADGVATNSADIQALNASIAGLGSGGCKST